MRIDGETETASRRAMATDHLLLRSRWWGAVVNASARAVHLRNVIAYAVLSVALLIGAYRLETTTNETHSALCTFKADLARRYIDGQAYVDDVVNGERELLPGFTLADLNRSLANQRATLDSLSALSC